MLMINLERLAIILAILLCAISPTMAIAAHAGHLRAAHLRCESKRDPLGIDERLPRLGWIVESDRRAETQTAYRLLVASTMERLAHDEGDLWDTGRVQSDETTHIVYRGKPLNSRQRCFWKVMTWDRDGAAGPWSEPARWEMGLLTPDDWNPKWIDVQPVPADIELVRAMYCTIDGSVRKDVTPQVAATLARGEPIVAGNEALGGDPARNLLKHLVIEYRCDGVLLHADVPENGTAMLAHSHWPYLRKAFAAEKSVRQARLYVTALGMYETYLNGQRIGDHHLAPGWTDYRRRVNYQVFDVTNQINRGENMLGAIVGPGWFSGRAGLFHLRQFYGDRPALLAQLEITYSDGSTSRIVSDDSWQFRAGPLLAADLMDGDIYDARAEVAHWCEASSDDSGWKRATTRPESRNLEAGIDQPVRVLREMPAQSLTEPSPGAWTFDLGQNMVGVVRLKVSEPAGTVITIRHGEMLNPDGTIYTANLRGAAATDTYICKGGGEQWQPAFTYHGFRYVEVTGLSSKPALDTITGIVLGSDLPVAGTFECSDADLNQLQSNIVWGLRGNYVSIPTDCPQRDERMGWMADTQVFAPTAAFNADIAAFMSKWMIDVDDAQRQDGAHSDVAPAMKGLNYGTPAWADAGTIVPWTLYQMYGDTRILERYIDSMMRWVQWCKANSTDLIRDHARGNDYGDWLSIGADTPKDLIGAAYFARSTQIVADALHVLGREEESQQYRRLFEDIRQAFIARYVDAAGHVQGETQCGYVLALRFHLLPEEMRPAAMSYLVADIEARGWRLSTGFVGVGLLLPTLEEVGRTDVAWRLLMQDAFPSWLFSVRHGATTIWERWNGWTPETGVHPDASMNSFNHYSLGSCGQWLFEGVGGIRPDPEHPGFKHFFIRPAMAPPPDQFENPVVWARTTYQSIRGEVSTHWMVDGARLTLRITIPANTTATVYVPVLPGREVLESGRPLQEIEGVQILKREIDQVLLAVGSGEYEFTSRAPWVMDFSDVKWDEP